jgi:hypothetical protein
MSGIFIKTKQQHEERQGGKLKRGRGGKKLLCPYFPHGMKWNKSHNRYGNTISNIHSTRSRK